MSVGAQIPAAARNVLAETLKLLRRVFVVSVVDNGIEAHMATLCWVIVVPFGFIEMVRQHDPFSLVLLAHYTVLLKRVGERRWWMEGKAEALLQRIVRCLGGLSKDQLERGVADIGELAGWRAWIEWPLQEVGTLHRRREDNRSWSQMSMSGASSVGGSLRGRMEGLTPGTSMGGSAMGGSNVATPSSS
jgi:hypothetical protein